MIKIATIYTLFGQRGGAELFSEKLIDNLSAFKNEVKVVVYCNKKAMEVLSSHKNVELIYVSWLDNQIFKALWLELFAWFYLSFNKIDLFWNPSGANHFPGLFFPKTISTILDIGEFFVKNKYGKWRLFYRRTICLPRTLKRSAKIVTISRATANAVQSIFNYKKEITAIHLAADPWDNSKEVNNNTSGNNSMVTGAKEHLLCVGRIDYINKGVDIIMDSYIELQKKHDMPKLIFAGSLGVAGEKLMNAINENNLSDKVEYLGRVDNDKLEELYKKAIVNILASRYEGFGITLLESFRRGVPVLCSDLEVLNEIGDDAPIYFKSESVEDFKEKLLDIIQCRTEIKKHIERGFDVAQRYSWNKTTDEYLAVIKQEYNNTKSGN